VFRITNYQKAPSQSDGTLGDSHASQYAATFHAGYPEGFLTDDCLSEIRMFVQCIECLDGSFLENLDVETLDDDERISYRKRSSVDDWDFETAVVCNAAAKSKPKIEQEEVQKMLLSSFKRRMSILYFVKLFRNNLLNPKLVSKVDRKVNEINVKSGNINKSEVWFVTGLPSKLVSYKMMYSDDARNMAKGTKIRNEIVASLDKKTAKSNIATGSQIENELKAESIVTEFNAENKLAAESEARRTTEFNIENKSAAESEARSTDCDSKISEIEMKKEPIAEVDNNNKKEDLFAEQCSENIGEKEGERESGDGNESEKVSKTKYAADTELDSLVHRIMKLFRK